MKLNKYIYAKLKEGNEDYLGHETHLPTKEDIEDWITEWYMDTFKEINFGDTAGVPRPPPMWLAGPRWYDRRKRMIEEAEKLKAAEAKSYEKDE
jgi:hypothetical protein